MRLTKSIVYFGQRATVACDGRCGLADHELGDAPADPGTYEGGHAKPSAVPVDDPAVMNKWCVRECERCSMTPPGMADSEPAIRDFSRRRYNIPASEGR